MTDKAFPRKQFDRELVFVVQRHIQLSGEVLTPGTIFDKSLVTDRKLRQLYDQRYLRFAEAADMPPPQRRKAPRAFLRQEVTHGSSEG